MDSSSDEEENMLRYITEKQSQNADEIVVTAVKQMGKELYAHLSPEKRQDKLDSMVSNLQHGISSHFWSLPDPKRHIPGVSVSSKLHVVDHHVYIIVHSLSYQCNFFIYMFLILYII